MTPYDVTKHLVDLIDHDSLWLTTHGTPHHCKNYLTVKDDKGNTYRLHITLEVTLEDEAEDEAPRAWANHTVLLLKPYVAAFGKRGILLDTGTHLKYQGGSDYVVMDGDYKDLVVTIPADDVDDETFKEIE